MSDQDRSGIPDDEPVIGGVAPQPSPPPASSPTLPPPARPTQAVPPPPVPSRPRRDPYGIGGGPGISPDAGYYGTPRRGGGGRTATVYFFVLVSLAVVGVLIFLLFQVLSGGNGEESVATPTPVPVALTAAIESPVAGDRIPVNEERAVIVSVTSGEPIVRYELLISGIVTDRQTSGRLDGENTYKAVLTARFAATGSYDLVVRATTESGEQVVSESIRVIVDPAAAATPEVVLSGEIVVVASLRTGPSDVYPQAGTLAPPQVVVVIGRVAGDGWLQVETGGGLWVRRSAVEISEADLAQVPIVDASEPAPTPATESTATATPPPDETETPTPDVPADAPDLQPSNAVLIDGGATLRVTIRNVATSAFSGAIVVLVENVPANPAEQVVTATIEPNGATAINFTLDPPLDVQSTVSVTVDPDDAIVESNEDNNVTEFIVVPPADEAILWLDLQAGAGVLFITIWNDGAELLANEALLTVSVPGETFSRDLSPLTIEAEGSFPISPISLPITGDLITVTLAIDGVSVATATIPNPNAIDPPADGEDPDGDPPTDGDPEEPTEPEEPEGG